MANINFTVQYNPAVAVAEEDPFRGNLLSFGTQFASNGGERGLVLVGFAGTTPTEGNGTVAEVRFRAAGKVGESPPLTLAVSKINNAGGAVLPIALVHGRITIVGQKGPCDCNGDGQITWRDAICPLLMSVRKMIAEGKGVQKDFETAGGWIRLAAEQGNAGAQYYLGWMYQNGQGLQADIDEARRWYQKAAAQGNQNAAQSLNRLGKTKSDDLQGTWVCVATTEHGAKAEKWVGVRVVIDGDDLTSYYPLSGGAYREQKAKFRVESAQTPKHLDWWPLDQPDWVDQRIYAIEGGILRMATNLDAKTRPKTFESGRWQFTAERVH